MLLNLERAVRTMQERKLDALIAAAPENILYLSDSEAHLTLNLFGPPNSRTPRFYAVLPARSDLPATFIGTGASFGFLVDRPTWMPQIKMWGDPGRAIPEPGTVQGDAETYASLLRTAKEHGGPGSANEVLAKTLDDMGLAGGRLAVDDAAVRTTLQEQVLSQAELVDGYETFRYIRAVKSEEELECLHRSTQANDRAIDALVAAIRPGVSWGELKLEYDRAMIEAGALPGFWGMATGPATYRFNWMQSDSPALARAVGKSELIRLDLGGTYRNYWSDCTRTAVLNTAPPEWMARASKALAVAHEACSEFLRPGASMGKAIQAYEEVVQKEGFPGFQAAWGHGLGLDCYDFPTPRIQRNTTEVFEENMVVNIEGGPAVIGEGQFNYEITYRITANGPEKLSTDTGEIRELG